MQAGQKRPRPEGDDQGDSERDNIKYKPPADPLELEAQLKEMIPLPHVSKRQWDEWYNRYVEENSTVKFIKAQKESAATEKNINTTFVLEFKQWLQGRSRWNVDVRPDGYRKCTPWGPQNLFFLPGVTDYLRSYLGKKSAYQLKLALLYMRGPRDLNEAFIYYKFLVRGDELENENGYLDDTLEYFPWGKKFQMYSGLENGVDSGKGLGWPTNKEAAEYDLAKAELRTQLVGKDSSIVLAKALSITPEEARQLVSGLSSTIDALAQYTPNTSEILDQAYALLGAYRPESGLVSTRELHRITKYLGSLDKELMTRDLFDKARKLAAADLPQEEFEGLVRDMVDKLLDTYGEDEAHDIMEKIAHENRDDDTGFAVAVSQALNKKTPGSGAFDDAGNLVELYNHPDRYTPGLRDELRARARQLLKERQRREEEANPPPSRKGRRGGKSPKKQDTVKQEPPEGEVSQNPSITRSEESSGSLGKVASSAANLISSTMDYFTAGMKERTERRRRQAEEAEEIERQNMKREEERQIQRVAQKAFDVGSSHDDIDQLTRLFDDAMLMRGLASLSGSDTKDHEQKRLAFVAETHELVSRILPGHKLEQREPMFMYSKKYTDAINEENRRDVPRITGADARHWFDKASDFLRQFYPLFRDDPTSEAAEGWALHVLSQQESGEEALHESYERLRSKQAVISGAQPIPQLTAPQPQQETTQQPFPQLTAPPESTAEASPQSIAPPQQQETAQPPVPVATNTPEEREALSKKGLLSYDLRALDESIFPGGRYDVNLGVEADAPEDVKRQYMEEASRQYPGIKAAREAAKRFIDISTISFDPEQRQYFAAHAKSLLDTIGLKNLHVGPELLRMMGRQHAESADDTYEKKLANLPGMIKSWADYKIWAHEKMERKKPILLDPYTQGSGRKPGWKTQREEYGKSGVSYVTKVSEPDSTKTAKRSEKPTRDWEYETSEPDIFTGEVPEDFEAGRKEFYATSQELGEHVKRPGDLLPEEHEKRVAETRQATRSNYKATLDPESLETWKSEGRKKLIEAAQALAKERSMVVASPDKPTIKRPVATYVVYDGSMITKYRQPKYLAPEDQPIGAKGGNKATVDTYTGMARGYAENIATNVYKTLPFSTSSNGMLPTVETANAVVKSTDNFVDGMQKLVKGTENPESRLRLAAHLAHITDDINTIYSKAGTKGLTKAQQTELRTTVLRDAFVRSQVMFKQLDDGMESGPRPIQVPQELFDANIQMLQYAARMVGATVDPSRHARKFKWEAVLVTSESDQHPEDK